MKVKVHLVIEKIDDGEPMNPSQMIASLREEADQLRFALLVLQETILELERRRDACN